ncbi:MAG TPA: TIGR03620 family F420-dependent LLM class oxidoreductase [Candidatus Limnocylindrales bacterium]|nr:TIGR03620 family F420-dependent LLM class oxidoreductase [Candidatus Limnocylindrales bacterium]
MSSRIGPAGVWSSFDRLPGSEVIDFARAAEAAGYDTVWTQESAGRDPFALLAALAARTDRIGLGVGIAILYGRDPVAMKAGAATVHELSGGRMLLGIGASHRDTVSEVRGHGYGPPLSAMREYLAAYASAPYRGPQPYGPAPVVLAALRERMLRLSGTDADGAFPYLVPASYVPGARSRLDAAATGRPRPMLIVSQACLLETDPLTARTAARRYLDRYLGLPNYLANLRQAGFSDADLAKPGSDRLVDALVAWGDPATVRTRLHDMLQAGADQVAMIPLTAEGLHADRSTMEALAPPW